MAENFFCDGVEMAPQRSLFNALGMTHEEMKRPLVGIVSSYNEIVPGHMNIDKIVEAVKLGVAMGRRPRSISGNRGVRRYCNGTQGNEIFSGNPRSYCRFN